MLPVEGPRSRMRVVLTLAGTLCSLLAQAHGLFCDYCGCGLVHLQSLGAHQRSFHSPVAELPALPCKGKEQNLRIVTLTDYLEM